MSKAVFVSDPHVGGDRFGSTAAEWDAPLAESVSWAIENNARVFVIPGDLFHKRNPTTEEYERVAQRFHALVQAGIRIVVVDGNHDIGATPDAIATTWWLRNFMFGGEFATAKVMGKMPVEPDFEFVILPWPRLVDWVEADSKLTLPEQLVEARRNILKHLYNLCALPVPEGRTRILVSHAMVSYGKTTPDDPGMMLGKDIVLPYEDLTALKDVKHVILGHVHNPESPGYVGSTQPTDWGEATQTKSFVVLENGELTRIPYKTSLKLWDIEVLSEQGLEAVYAQGERDGPFDVARARIEVDGGWTVDPEAVRAHLSRYAKRVLSVEIVAPRVMHTRIEGGTKVTTLSPTEAFRTWLDVKQIDIPDAIPTFDRLVDGETVPHSPATIPIGGRHD